MNYVERPVDGQVYGGGGGMSELFVDASRYSQHPVTHQLAEPLDEALRDVLRGIYLVFEQGCNAPPYVLALRSHPEVDQASMDRGLHYLPNDTTNIMDFSSEIREFHAPIEQYIQSILTEGGSRETKARKVVRRLFERIAEVAVLRAVETDEDGNLDGLDRDIAPELVSAWDEYCLKQTSSPA